MECPGAFHYGAPMRVQEIISAPKTILDWGKAQQGNMGPSIFPLQKRKKQTYRLGGSYRWRLIKFEALGNKFRLLIAFSTQLDRYQAILGKEVGADLSVLMEYSYEHGGWHVHASCGDTHSAPSGVMRGPWIRRIPKGRNFHRRTEYTKYEAGMSDNVALQIAIDRFNLGNERGTLFATGNGGPS